MNIKITRPTLTEEERKRKLEQIERAIVEIYMEKGNYNEE